VTAPWTLDQDPTQRTRTRPMQRLDLPEFTYVPATPVAKPAARGLVGSALLTGGNELLATGGTGIEAFGRASGIQGIERLGAGIAENREAAAALTRREDLEGNVLDGRLAEFLPRLGYQAIKQVPNIAASVAAAYAAPVGLATRIGMALPRVLGGGTAAAGKFALGGAAVGLPQGVGSLYGAAKDREEAGGAPATREDAIKAIVGGAPYAALDAVSGTVPFLGKVIAKGMAGGVVKRTLTGFAENAAQETVQEGAQTAMEMTFRSDLTPKEKFGAIVDAAVTGGFVGGTFGGVGGALSPSVRATKTADPAALTNDDMAATVDEVVQGPIAQPPVPEQRALPAGAYRMGPAGSSSTAPEDLLTPFTPPVDPAPPTLSPEAPVGAQGDLFGGPEVILPPTPAVTPRVDAPVVPQTFTNPDPAQQPLFEEPTGPSEGQQEMQDFARQATGRMSPFVKSLTAQDPVELVMQVQDAIAKPKPPQAAVVLAQKFGLIDQTGRPVDLPKAIEKETAKLWKLAPKVESSPAAARRFAAQQEVVRTLEMQQEVLSAVAARRSPPAAPDVAVVAPDIVEAAPVSVVAPEAAPVAAPEIVAAPVEAAPVVAPASEVVAAPEPVAAPVTREQQVVAMRDRLKQIVGRKTQFIAKLDAATDDEVRAAVLTRLESGSAAGDTMKLAEAFGIDVNAPATTAPVEAPVTPAAPAAPREWWEEDDAPAPAPVATLTTLSPRKLKQLPETELQELYGVERNAQSADEALIAEADRIAGLAEPEDTGKRLTPKQKRAQRMMLKMTASEVTQKGYALNEDMRSYIENELGMEPAAFVEMQREAQAARQRVRQRAAAITRAENEMQRRTAGTAPATITEPVVTETAAPASEATPTAEPTPAPAAEAAPEATPEPVQETAVPEQPLPKPKIAKWAKEFLSQGQSVIYADAEVALIRSFGTTMLGKPVTMYIPMNRKGSYPQAGDIFNTTPGAVQMRRTKLGVTEAKEQVLLAAANADIAEEARLLALFPEGPFTGKTESVVGDTAIPPVMVQQVEQLLQAMGLGGVRVFLTTPQTAQTSSQRQSWHLYGPYASALTAQFDATAKYGSTRRFGPNANDHYIAIDTRRSAQLVYETLQHELGHILYSRAFTSESTETKQAVIDAYQQWLVDTQGMSDQQMVASTRTAGIAKDIAMDARRNSNDTGYTLTASSRAYFKNFEEWFADQVARYVTTEEAPRSIVEKFFASVAKSVRALVQLIYGAQPYTTAAMKAYLDGRMARAKAGEFGGLIEDAIQAEGETDAKFSKAPEFLNTQTQRVAAAASTLKNRFDRTATLQEKVRKESLAWSSMTHISAQFRKLFDLGNGLNGLETLPEVEQERSATSAHFAQLFDKAWSGFKTLEKATPKAAETVGKLMRWTEHDIDPRKSWDEHTWLHTYTTDRTGGQKRNADPRLERMVAEANAQWRELKRQKHDGVYTNLKEANDSIHFAQLSMDLYTTVVSDPALKSQQLNGFDVSPIDAFKEPGTGRAETIQNARAFWQETLTAQLEALDQFYAAQAGSAATGTAAERNAIDTLVRPLMAQSRDVKRAMEAMERAPYFHLGRTGEYFTSFALRTISEVGPDGQARQVVDPVALERVAQALEEDAQVTGVEISRDTTKPSVFIRFETQEQMTEAWKVVQRMVSEGFVQPGQEANPAKKIAEVQFPKKGERASENPASGVSPRWVQRLITDIESSPAFAVTDDMSPDERAQMNATREKLVARVRNTVVDMLPDMSITKVMTHRKSVAGYNRDMVQNFAQRMQVGAVTLANLAAEPKKLDAMSQMKAAINAAQRSMEVSPEDTITMQAVYRELARRDAERPLTTGRTVWDTLRAWNHAYFLGLSPSYVLINFTQIGVTLWPELAKQHGYVKAFTAIRQVTPMAFKIMAAVFREGRQRGQAADAIITEEVLAKAGVPKEVAAFIMQVANTGNLDIGSASRELGRVAEGNIEAGKDRMLRLAASFGYYSETTSRLIAALSARELNGQTPGLDKYVRNVLNDAMFNYSAFNTPRRTGKMGIAGPFSPVMFSFMTYQFQLLEKLFREFGQAVGTNEEDRIASQRFLKAHMGAMLVVAGSLGMPAASVLARAAEALVDLFDDDEEPYDAKAAWRNFLADTFGKDVGEILAKGAFRAAGIDIANRAGEQDILPFSRWLTDRRSWEDATKDWAVQMLGSPISMVSNIVAGGVALAEGDVMGGLDKMLPTAIKGPERAFRMTTEGYVDASGNVLPMSAGATDILAQALGFTPSELAEYTEARRTQTSRKGEVSQQASLLRQKLALAYERKDAEAFREGMQRARLFDRVNPAYAVLPGLSEAITRRATARQRARLTLTPLGTNIRDQQAQQLTNFANY
jgi:hypothetical protein